VKKKHVWTVLKFAIPIAIVIWLLTRVPGDQYRQLRDRPKDWTLLAAATGVVFSAVSLTFIRWYLLVRALSLPFRLADAFRLGFLGYLLNFVSPSSVGGDAFKAFFIAREQPGRRPEAVATVVVDRVVGLCGLLLLTSCVIVCGGASSTNPQVSLLARSILGVTVTGLLGVFALLVSGFAQDRLTFWVSGLPRVGRLTGRLLLALRVYRLRWRTVCGATLMSMVSHGLFALAIFLIAKALFTRVPTLGEHLLIVPLGATAGMLPFPGGLGAFEFAMQKLYEIIPAGDIEATGVLVALVYRLMTILVATVGAWLYWAGRSEVRGLLQEAQRETESGD